MNELERVVVMFANYSRKIQSGTEGYPSPHDVYVSLLGKLVKGNHFSGWAHFMWMKKLRWYQSSGLEPFIEVVLCQNEMFELNLSLPGKIEKQIQICEKKGLLIPESWTLSKRSLKLPTSETHLLANWIQDFFLKVHEAPSDFNVQGYLDGL